MASQQQMDAVVSMIMVNLPILPMPVMVRRGSGDEASCSSHDLLSRAISCSIMECWQCLDSDAKQSKDLKERQKLKMQVLLDLNQANATLRKKHEHQDVPTQAIYDLFATYFRKYMAFYQGSADIRILPFDSIDVGSIIHAQSLQHIAAKRFNVQDHRAIPSHLPYKRILEEYSQDLYLDNQRAEC